MKSCFSQVRAILIVLVLLGVSSTAVAENRAGAFTLSPVVGLQFFSQSEDFQDSAFIGFHLGYNVTDVWGVEYVVTAATVDREPTGSGDLDYTTGRLDLLYHFKADEKFVPYIAAGVGSVRMNFGDHVDDDLLVNLGGGFKYAVNNWVALRLDARYSLRHEMTYKPTTHGDNFSNVIFSGGLIFQSKGKKAVIAIPTESIDNTGNRTD